MDGVDPNIELFPIDKPDTSEREEEDIERRTRCRLLGGGVGPAGVLSNQRDETIEPEKPSLMLREQLLRNALRIESLFLSMSSFVVVPERTAALPTAMAATMRRAKSSNPQHLPGDDVPAP